jgi:hypothetical protein
VDQNSEFYANSNDRWFPLESILTRSLDSAQERVEERGLSTKKKFI